MTIDIRTLRVSADVDSGKFVSGSEQVVTGANAMANAVKGIGAAVTETELKIGRAGDSVTRLSRLYVDGYAGAEKFNSAIRSLGTAMDKGNLSAERAATILDGIYKKYGMVADASIAAQRGQTGLAQAIEQANARFEAQSKIGGVGGNSTNRFLAGNLAAQGQDVLVTALMGMNPGTIGLQQGAQAAGALQMGGVTTLGGAAKALAGGLTELISPLTLATIGLTAGAAAAIQFGVKLYEGADKAKSASDILKDHEASIKGIADAYGAAMKSVEAYTAVSRNLVDLQSRTSNVQLGAQLRKEQNTFLDQLGVQRNTRTVGGNTFFADSDYKPFEDILRQLQTSIKNGKDGMDEFYASIKHITETNPALQTFADKIVNSVGELDKFARAMNAARDAATRLQINNSGPTLDPLGVFNPANDQDARAGRTPSLYQQNQNTLEAYKQNLYARTPDEKAAAARAQAAAQFNPSESSTARDYRIELAGQQALLSAEKALADAQRDRRLSLEKTVQDQQNEVSLIGKTGGEAAALRKEYELISQLRMDAAKNGTKVDEAEIALIKQKAAELGKLTDAYNRSKFDYEIGQQFGSLGRTSRQNQVYSTLQQYGLSTDLNSPQAGQLNRLYDAQEFKSSVTSFFTDFRQQIVSNGGDLGKALMTSLENAALNYVGKIWDKFFDQLASSVTKSLFPDLTGGPTSGNNSGSGLVGSLLNGYKTGDVTSAPLPSISAYAQAIKNIESSGGNYGALGPITASGDRAYGAYQVMGNNIPSWTKAALGYSMTPKEFLANPSAQDSVFNNQFGSYVSKYGPSGAAQAWFGGPGSVGKGGNVADMLGTTGTQYVQKFNDSVSKATGSVGQLGGGLSAAANGLGQFGGGLNSFSGQLANILRNGGASPGGSWLDQLLGSVERGLGGINPASPLWRANTTLGSFLGRGYADGGYTGNMSEKAVAGVVHGGEYVFSKAAVDKIGLMNLDSMHRTARGYATGGYVGSMPPAAANNNNASGNVQVNIVNNNGSDVSQKSRKTANGTAIDVMIDEAVAKKVSTPGSGTRRAMTSQFGLGGSLAKR